MEKNKDIQITLKGKQIFNPVYIEQELEEYCGNPCIEALPRIFDDKETIEIYFINHNTILKIVH